MSLAEMPSGQVDLDPGVPFHTLQVAEVIEETADARSFVLEIPPALDVPAALTRTFAYASGQFLTFRIPWGEFRIARCYSLASCPAAGEPHKVTVKRVAGGRMSNWLNDHLAAGAPIEVRPPAGAFVLHPGEHPLVLFGGGSGITPLISLLKSALLDTSRRIRLVYANRAERSIIFRGELEELSRHFGSRVEVIHHLDDRSGFLRPDQLHALVEGWDAADFYLCGPTPFMEEVEQVLEARGVPQQRIHLERFVSAVDPDRRTSGAAAPLPAPGEAQPQGFKLTLDRRTHEVPYVEGKTLLECAKQAGLEPPFSCEEGYCSCCMARLRAGRVAMAVNDALSAKDVAAGLVLTCQARPLTAEIWIDYDV
jgi:3-ketosteroid 9alpha-monooxygenase subunit B